MAGVSFCKLLSSAETGDAGAPAWGFLQAEGDRPVYRLSLFAEEGAAGMFGERVWI